MPGRAPGARSLRGPGARCRLPVPHGAWCPMCVHDRCVPPTPHPTRKAGSVPAPANWVPYKDETGHHGCQRGAGQPRGWTLSSAASISLISTIKMRFSHPCWAQPDSQQPSFMTCPWTGKQTNKMWLTACLRRNILQSYRRKSRHLLPCGRAWRALRQVQEAATRSQMHHSLL